MRLLKNSLVAASLLVGLATSAQAQTIFSEDFSASTGSTTPIALPANWTFFDIDGQTLFADPNNIIITDAWMQLQDPTIGTVNDGCAISNSWYDPAGQSDDWMFTPVINIPATGNFTLSWEGASQDPGYLETYEVYIITTAPTAGTLNTATLLTTVTSEPDIFTPHSVSLNAYLGQNVYIGFRNRSTDKYILKIDNVVVAAPSTDVAIDMLAPLTATMYPMSQIPAAGTTFSVLATNVGTSAITAPTVSFSVLNSGGTVISSATGTGTNLPNTGSVNQIGSATPLTWPMMLGNYTVQALNTTMGDANAANDTTMAMFAITDSVYALEMGANTGTLGIGSGATGYLGQSFFINNADTATSVSIYVDSGFTGTRYAAVIYNTDATGANPPTTILAATDTMMYDGTPGWKHLRLPANTVLSANMKYAVLAIEFDSLLPLGTNNNYFYPQNVWVQWPGNPNGANAWTNPVDLNANFAMTYLLRLNFASSLMVGVQENTFNNSLQVFPNPNNGNFTVQMDLGATADAEISVRNAEGKLVHTEQLGAQAQLQKTLNLQQLPAGVYFVQVRNAGHTYQQRIIKQ